MPNPYHLLFTPLAIGPVTAKNRFYQVPHCNGSGDAEAVAAMRETKAEGGWAVVGTENLMADEYSDISPYQAPRLWRDADIAVQAKMVEGVHKHGALAACELAHFGAAAANRTTRRPPLAPGSWPTMEGIDPRQSRAMNKRDIAAFRARHKAAAVRAKRAGFDIIYLYCSAENSIITQFFSAKLNDRGDEYGGSLSNRMRLFRELLADAREAAGERCAIAVRIAVAQLTRNPILQPDELREIIAENAEAPDLWDVNLNDWASDSPTSRMAKEGHEESHIAFVKSLTGKPVVGVGRFTSPDAMLSQIKRGVLDFIGAARPSIADPFLPRKIAEGRVEDIRECIGCNICITGENSFTPMRCTQNPTIMQEHSRGWHPEIVGGAGAADESALIIGGGAAGLECALTLARRGFTVTLAEARAEFGGRVALEARLPGLAEWIRVRDYRLGQLQKMAGVEMHLASPMTAEDVREYVDEVAPKFVICATGAKWRRDGIGRQHLTAVVATDTPEVFTPDDVFAGAEIASPVVIYDDDGGYIASAIAEKLSRGGGAVTIVTPHAIFARWTRLTLEQDFLRRRMHELGVEIVVDSELTAGGFVDGAISVRHLISGVDRRLAAASLLVITSRIPNDELHRQLPEAIRIGDCDAPGLIADAVFAGHAVARGL